MKNRNCSSLSYLIIERTAKTKLFDRCHNIGVRQKKNGAANRLINQN